MARSVGVLSSCLVVQSAAAQFGESFQPPEVPAPIPQAWLFEAPLMPAAVLGLFGIAAAFILNRQGKGKPALGCLLGGLVLAGALFASAALVTTERERVMLAAEGIVAAVAEPNLEQAEAAMRESVSLRMAFGASSSNREALLTQIERLHAVADVRSARVLDSLPDLKSETIAVVYVRVKVDGQSGGFPIPPYSWWEMGFARSSAGNDAEASAWKLASIEPLWIVGFDNPAGR